MVPRHAQPFADRISKRTLLGCEVRQKPVHAVVGQGPLAAADGNAGNVATSLGSPAQGRDKVFAYRKCLFLLDSH